ncbi:MAG: glycosyltransferase family 2 protein [Candidatus Omnitrophica bacterium]|nr:glycosyltransferase family 2 protein [Candidatus Omnitrophota bacterium]
MVVSIVIPVFNEENTISYVLDRVINADVCDLQKQIIVVDDGSTDRTPYIIEQAKKKFDGITVVNHERNLGKAAALKTGFSFVKGDIIIVQDADLEYDPSDYKKLVTPIIEGKADIVFGTRFHCGRPEGMPFIRYLINKFLTFMCGILHGVRVSDMETGYKVFSRKVLEKMDFVSDGFDFEPEFTILATKLKFIITEVGVSYKPRTVAHGKKIRFRDGISALITIFKTTVRRNR